MVTPLQTMELFVEVARARSFSRAAVTLGMPKSTLSRQIAELERSLGVRLLSRTTRKVDLTDAGQRYYDRCRHLVAEARLAQEEVRDLAATPAGDLRVNMPVDFGADFLAEAFVDFARRFPQVTFHLDSAAPDHAGRVFQTCDVAIEIGAQPAGTRIAREIGAIVGYLYASPGYLAQHGEPRHPDDLVRHDCLEFRTVEAARITKWPLHRGGEDRIEFHPESRFSLNSVSMVRRLAALDAGIAVLAEASARQELASGALRRILPEWEVGPYTVYAVTETRLLPAKTRVFLEFLTERLRADFWPPKAGRKRRSRA